MRSVPSSRCVSMVYNCLATVVVTSMEETDLRLLQSVQACRGVTSTGQSSSSLQPLTGFQGRSYKWPITVTRRVQAVAPCLSDEVKACVGLNFKLETEVNSSLEAELDCVCS